MTDIKTEATAATTAGATDPLAVELLQSIVDVARAIFGAQASSVFLLDAEAHELVFQTVSGRGEGFLVGRRFPAGKGIAGWVVASGEPIVVNDLSRDTAFDRSLAESTEYVPDSLMAAPLVSGDRMLGVLEVLDPVPQSRSSLAELDLLALFARQAAAGLRIAIDRTAGTGQHRGGDPRSPFDCTERAAAQQVVEALQRMLDAPAA